MVSFGPHSELAKSIPLGATLGLIDIDLLSGYKPSKIMKQLPVMYEITSHPLTTSDGNAFLVKRRTVCVKVSITLRVRSNGADH